MGIRSRRLAAVAFVIAAAVAPSGHAAEVNVAPPFDETFTDHSCFAFVLGTCSSSAEGDAEDGSVALDVEVVSPNGGELPGLGNGYAWVSHRVRGHLRRAVPAIELTVTLHVEHASAQVESMLADLAPGFDGYAYAIFDVQANAASCFCFGSQSRVLVAVDPGPAPATMTDEFVTLVFEIRDLSDGGEVQPGELNLDVAVWGELSLHPSTIPPIPDAGRVALTVEGSVTSVTARIVS